MDDKNQYKLVDGVYVPIEITPNGAVRGESHTCQAAPIAQCDARIRELEEQIRRMRS